MGTAIKLSISKKLLKTCFQSELMLLCSNAFAQQIAAWQLDTAMPESCRGGQSGCESRVTSIHTRSRWLTSCPGGRDSFQDGAFKLTEQRVFKLDDGLKDHGHIVGKGFSDPFTNKEVVWNF